MIRTLIVEDDFRIAAINAEFVTRVEGYRVVGTALSSSQARDMLRTAKPDLLLLDVYMPDFSGLELLEEVRQSHPEVDVIVITAAKETSAVEKALRLGAIDYIIKPIRFERLADTLNRYRLFRLRLGHERSVEQKDVDALRALFTLHESETTLPKGIDGATLKRVREIVARSAGGLTATELGDDLGVSRTTARRYLEYLISTGAIKATLDYGGMGRPTRRYQAV